MPDLELERFQRTLNLVDYARSTGYQPMPRDSSPLRATVLEHPDTHDRIAVARGQHGTWLYARLDGYTPRGAEEPPEQAYARLRECILRARDKGSIVEFVQSTQRVLGRDEVGLDRVREHLRAWDQAQRALEGQGRERSRSQLEPDPAWSGEAPFGTRATVAEGRGSPRTPSPQEVDHQLRRAQARTDWHQHLSPEHARALGLPASKRGPERG